MAATRLHLLRPSLPRLTLLSPAARGPQADVDSSRVSQGARQKRTVHDFVSDLAHYILCGEKENRRDVQGSDVQARMCRLGCAVSETLLQGMDARDPFMVQTPLAFHPDLT